MCVVVWGVVCVCVCVCVFVCVCVGSVVAGLLGLLLGWSVMCIVVVSVVSLLVGSRVAGLRPPRLLPGHRHGEGGGEGGHGSDRSDPPALHRRGHPP